MFQCLRRNHISRECRSKSYCNNCRGRHHTTICSRTSQGSHPVQLGPSVTPTTTNTVHTGIQSPVLLQTARLMLFNPTGTPDVSVGVRAIMDSGSQLTYVTTRTKELLQLPLKGIENVCIKTFGAPEGQDTLCDVVEISTVTREGENLIFSALVVPFICNPLTSQPIDLSRNSYEHLHGLELADSADVGDTLEIDLLIGSDVYWNLATGKVIRGKEGPLAVHTKVGWVLSGPTVPVHTSVHTALTMTHLLKIDAYPSDQILNDSLQRFWDLESLGIAKEEPSVYDTFLQQISFNGERYEVSLQWRNNHPKLPDNYQLCYKRLCNLVKKLKQTPSLLSEYNKIIQDQLDRGIVEIVDDPSTIEGDKLHYLPHRGVVREDKVTSKLRIVYDASAKSNGPSLNDCLYTGPSFGQSIFDILLRFRAHRIALAGDIEKAFLMVAVNKKDRDVLRFLWTSELNNDTFTPLVLRFTRVVFGVSSSPFLLNATVNHHIESYRSIDPSFVDKFLSAIYVDDLSLSSPDVDSMYQLYRSSRVRLLEAGSLLENLLPIQKSSDN